MEIRIGTIIKTKLNEQIRITGYRSIRGKYFYLFKDEFNSKGYITRANLLDALNDGARIVS
jgi:hypothetical protein